MHRSPEPPFLPRLSRVACAGLALAAALLATASGTALAQCTYVPLNAGVPVSTGAATTLYTFTSPGHSWGAIGVRSASGSEHDLGVFGQTAASPACVQNQVGASALSGGVDFVIGDFRPGRDALGPWYGKVSRSSGSGTALAEWDSGGVSLVVDAPPVNRNTDHVLNVYKIFLEAGTSYVIVFAPSPGVDAKVLLFRNPGTGAYWSPRSGRVLETAGVASFQAPESDEYALVVVNDDGGFSSYSLAVDQCQPPIALTSNAPVSTSPPLRYSIAQTNNYWSACGVRGNGAEDWDILAYKTSSGNLEPECFKDTLAVSSLRGAAVDLVVGDFNANPLTPYYTRVVQFAGAQPGVVKWDGGMDELVVNAPPLVRATGPSDVVEIWDVSMIAGATYSIYFQKSGAVDAKFLVFENPQQIALVPYWAGRGGAVLTGAANTDYVPAASGYHGIAVVSDNGGVGGYQLAVYAANTGVGDARGAALPVGIEAFQPNPTLGRASLTYRLSKPGRVAFDVLDVTGRQVARVAELDAAAGEGSITFDARSGGHRLPSGIYFVRMSLGGGAVSFRKFILLP